MKRLFLSEGETAASYSYVNSDGVSDPNTTTSDHDLLHITLDALNSPGFSRSLHSILSVIAAILHLGNVHFDSNANDHAEISRPEAASALKNAATCLGVDLEELKLALSTKRLVIVGERTDNHPCIPGPRE